MTDKLTLLGSVREGRPEGKLPPPSWRDRKRNTESELTRAGTHQGKPPWEPGQKGKSEL